MSSAAPRRWIIGKDRRICPRACQGWSKPTCKLAITDAATGAFTKKCRECGAEEDGLLDKFKDRRPCTQCKVVHNVTVSLWAGRNMKDEKAERWRERCSICELENSAAQHQQMARNFFARAVKLRAEQKRKQIRAEASKSIKALVMQEIAMGAAPAIATNETIRGLIEAEEKE